MGTVLKRIGFGFLIAGLALALVATAVQARNPGGIAVPKAVVPAQPEPLLPATYTLEELQSVPPMPLNMVVVGPDGLAAPVPGQEDNGATDTSSPLSVSSGWDPQSGSPQPEPGEFHTLENAPVSLANWGLVPSNPNAGPYPPFQRWTWFGNYAVQSTQTIGVLFIDLDNNGTYDGRCTASVIGRRTIATAGQCVSDGAGTYFYHFLFCPAWYKGAGSGAPQPGFGCWVAGSPHAEADSGTWGWHQIANPDRDFACLLTNPVGDTYPGKVGDKTGWNAVAANGDQKYSVMTFGYPDSAGAPFPGYHLIADVSTQTYGVSVYGGSQVTSFIGSDLTHGSNGGPWFLGFGHRAAEYARFTNPLMDEGDGTGGSPGSFVPWLYGVNATRRCAGFGCAIYPPTATDGPFWDEMGSPEFLDDGPGGDGEQVRDVFSLCWAAE